MPNERLRDEDAGRSACHKCHATDRTKNLVLCDALHCDNHICEECATEAEWELEACSDQHAAAVAGQMRRTIYALRADVRRREERRAA